MLTRISQSSITIPKTFHIEPYIIFLAGAFGIERERVWENGIWGEKRAPANADDNDKRFGFQSAIHAMNIKCMSTNPNALVVCGYPAPEKRIQLLPSYLHDSTQSPHAQKTREEKEEKKKHTSSCFIDPSL